MIGNADSDSRDLLEAEMFGVARGVATGVEKRPGMFETADGGTLFLDEVGELAPTLQAKLLRALQEKEIQPVGGRPRKIDVRVIAATNVDLDPRSGRGGLRQDLYYRLAAWVLEVPPLRRRRDDIPDLVRYFLRRGAVEAGVRPPEIDAAALRRLEAYDWPGNVRELEHEMRRIVLRAGGAVRIGVANLDPRLRATAPGDGVSSDGLDGLALAPRLEALERKLIQEALRRTGGHKLEAARLLEISRNGLAKKLERLEMKKSWASDESAA